ncbi:MAG: serine/threonine-protein kinase [Bdellovibrionota bacterium]
MKLTPEQWAEVNAHFHRALELEGSDRAAYLAAIDTPLLKQQVDRLVRSHLSAGDFLAVPLWQEALEGIAEPSGPGTNLGDFTLVRAIGAGGCGTVFLGKQHSLDRIVAVKIVPNLGEEARTMAHLEHPHIVKVHTQLIDDTRQQRWICMQYVDGASLDRCLTQKRFATPEILRMGAQLAEALEFAHRRGIFHLDVKPANILIDHQGTPYLSDFNVSFNTSTGDPTRVLGGTLKYMSPEHLSAFRNEGTAVDHRADLYSLALVIKEMLLTTAERPSAEVKAVLDRALATNPEDRFESAAQMAKALEGLLELLEIESQMPPESAAVRFANKHALFTLLLAALFPQLLGSIVNISYNSIRIVSSLTPAQQKLFEQLVLSYNVIVYPIAIAILAVIVRPMRGIWARPRARVFLGANRLAALRAHVLQLPRWLILITSLGWLPGAVYFPACLAWMAGPLPGEVFVHFAVSFVLSWLVALTYSYLGTKFVALRVLYPKLWTGTGRIRETAAGELPTHWWRAQTFFFLAGLVPLVASALVLLLVSSAPSPAIFQSLRHLLMFLHALTLVGLVLSVRATSILAQTLYALTGQRRATSK